MPRYLLATAPACRPLRDAAIDVAARRFPEVAVELRYAAHDYDSGHDVWVCSAPSETHVRRWAEAAGLEADHAQHVDADDATVTSRSLPSRTNRPVAATVTLTEPGGSER